MKRTLCLIALAILGLQAACSAAPAAPGSPLDEMVRQLQQHPEDEALREQIIRYVRGHTRSAAVPVAHGAKAKAVTSNGEPAKPLAPDHPDLPLLSLAPGAGAR